MVSRISVVHRGASFSLILRIPLYAVAWSRAASLAPCTLNSSVMSRASWSFTHLKVVVAVRCLRRKAAVLNNLIYMRKCLYALLLVSLHSHAGACVKRIDQQSLGKRLNGLTQGLDVKIDISHLRSTVWRDNQRIWDIQ